MADKWFPMLNGRIVMITEPRAVITPETGAPYLGYTTDYIQDDCRFCPEEIQLAPLGAGDLPAMHTHRPAKLTNQTRGRVTHE